MVFNKQNNILLSPLPVTSLKNQAITGFIIGLSVFLILIIFQPFGTFESRVNHKSLFLAGYGIICTSVYIGYYSLLMILLKKWFAPHKWNIIKEVVTIIPMLIIMSGVSLLYHHKIIGGYNIGISDVFYFFRLSLEIAIIPFSALLYRKWIKSRLTTTGALQNSTDYVISFESFNKKEKPVVINSEDLIYIKSNGNYIEIAGKEGIKTQLIRNSLNNVESKLSEKDFLKIHRSYIVNIRLIESLIISGSSYSVKIRNTDIQLPVSRSMIKTVRKITGS